jgi:hypothetical protein
MSLYVINLFFIVFSLMVLSFVLGAEAERYRITGIMWLSRPFKFNMAFVLILLSVGLNVKALPC